MFDPNFFLFGSLVYFRPLLIGYFELWTVPGGWRVPGISGKKHFSRAILPRCG
jgi:hypothetical protein